MCDCTHADQTTSPAQKPVTGIRRYLPALLGTTTALAAIGATAYVCSRAGAQSGTETALYTFDTLEVLEQPKKQPTPKQLSS